LNVSKRSEEKKLYINKAIVEEQTQKRSTHAGLLWYGRLNFTLHSVKEFWTRTIVIIFRKISIDTPNWYKNQKGKTNH